MQWADEGLSCEAGGGLEELMCVEYLAWQVVRTVGVFSTIDMTYCSQPPLSGS